MFLPTTRLCCVGIKSHSEWPRVVRQMLARIAPVALPTASRRERPCPDNIKPMYMYVSEVGWWRWGWVCTNHDWAVTFFFFAWLKLIQVDWLSPVIVITSLKALVTPSFFYIKITSPFHLLRALYFSQSSTNEGLFLISSCVSITCRIVQTLNITKKLAIETPKLGKNLSNMA